MTPASEGLRAAAKGRLRAVVVCPGRGSYTKSELGTLDVKPDPAWADAESVASRTTEILDQADALRIRAERPTIRELDGAGRFRPQLHLAGENASSLIYTLTAIDALTLTNFDVVAVAGNSLGWYTALHVAGALSFQDGLRIVEATGGYQSENLVGGQVVYPLTDEHWRPKDDLAETVASALKRANGRGFAATSVLLGGAVVIAGDDPGLAGLRAGLPRVRRSSTSYPLRLAGHGAFHTPLMEPMADHIGPALEGLNWSTPRVSMIDGRGHIWRPLTTRTEELRAYTLKTQITTAYDFAGSIAVALREFAPDVLLLLGPGRTLAGTLGQILALEGWSGVRSKDNFKIRQESPRPILV